MLKKLENEGILIQGRGNYCSKLKTGKLKSKRLLKNTILDEQEPSVQSADRAKTVQVWSSAEYVFTKSWKLAPSHLLYLKINSGFHARENPSEAKVLKVVRLGSYIK